MVIPERTPAERLLSAAAVRERCGVMVALAENGATAHFRLHPERLDAAADYVIATMRANYPTLEIPFHSRWRHFTAGGRDRWRELRAALAGDAPGNAAPDEIARVAIELAIVSVLLDAGAGAAWRYREAGGAAIGRSEGLAVASIALYRRGGFASERGALRADAARLGDVSEVDLAAAFQAGADNPLAGLAGRAALMRNLGAAVAAQPETFGAEARLGNLFDAIRRQAIDGAIAAAALLEIVLRAFNRIWPGRIVLDGVPLGDVWRHRAFRTGDATAELVPFHKLAQWLAYSLIEPLQEAGLRVTAIDGLTGLAEYRNGGLFLDLGVIAPIDPDLARRALKPGDEAVVEWRALTVGLLDRLAGKIRAKLGADRDTLPLAKISRRRHLVGGAAHRAGNAPRRRPAACDRERRHRILTRAIEDGTAMPQDVTVLEHPLVRHKLSMLRRKSNSTSEFRQLVRELAALFVYEVTRDLPVTDTEIETPLMKMQAPILAGKKLCLLPILRAGLGLLDGMLDLLPSARVGHIGLYRDPATLAAVEYYLKVPEDVASRLVIILDPMLATGNSAVAAVTRMKEMGVESMRFVCLLAAPEGVHALRAAHPDVPIYTASIDSHLNDHAYIVPGLGDAGDRLFGTK